MLRQWSSLKYSDCKSESSTRRIANPTERLLTHNSLHPPLPPPFQEGEQFACHAIQVPPRSCPELCRRSNGRLGGDGQPPRISRISTDNLSFKIRYVKILVIRWKDSAANKKPLLPGEQFDDPCQKIQLKKFFAKKSAHLHKRRNTL